MAQIKTNLQYGVTGSLQTANVANDAIGLAQMASGTDGNIITYDASGNPAVVASGTSGHFLKSQGADTVPVFAAAGGGKLGQIIYQSTTFDSTHSSDTQVANLSITPSATSSTILIMSVLVAQPNDSQYFGVKIYRDTLASGTLIFNAGEAGYNGTGGGGRFHYTFSYIDSPSTTSAQDYSIVAVPNPIGSGESVRFGCGASNMFQLWEILA